MSIQNQEALLQAWIGMNVCIRGNRILSSMSLNEILIAGILYRNQKGDSCGVTATELCSQTRLLKSQVNKLISGMEEKGLIERIRSSKDKRKVYIRMREENLHIYLEEHDRIMKLMNKVAEAMGEEKVSRLTELINEATSIVDKVQREA